MSEFTESLLCGKPFLLLFVFGVLITRSIAFLPPTLLKLLLRVVEGTPEYWLCRSLEGTETAEGFLI